MTIYDFTVMAQDGAPSPSKHIEAKYSLIVNTATGCGLTPQYQGLQELYERYHDQGFEILDFPCNQFMGQAPGSAEEINQFCSLHYRTSFPRFAKNKSQWERSQPLYQWLKEQASGPLGSRIEWNFAKFLINRQGQVIHRFSSKLILKQLKLA